MRSPTSTADPGTPERDAVNLMVTMARTAYDRKDVNGKAYLIAAMCLAEGRAVSPVFVSLTALLATVDGVGVGSGVPS